MRTHCSLRLRCAQSTPGSGGGRGVRKGCAEARSVHTDRTQARGLPGD